MTDKYTKGFASWFDAFKSIRDDVLEREFDIAIVGAGAYGLSLVADIKKVRKTSHKPMLFYTTYVWRLWATSHRFWF